MRLTKKILLPIICTILISNGSILAQFAPPVGQAGTTAIHADSNVFVGWASSCNVTVGYADISIPENGVVTYGTDNDAIGKADNGPVSLGDGGFAVTNFDVPISNGDGWDFAIFENSFSNDFLELAFVEVSSNGQDYYRFSSISSTQSDTQISTFGLVDATKINNLAGKYRAMYGTPFDLDELKNIDGLDVSHIISIKIIDVVGCLLNNYATFDSEGNKINDPWPTPFETGGFDLDAIGVINNEENTGVNILNNNKLLSIYPNPATHNFAISANKKINLIVIYSFNGIVVKKINNPNIKNINIDNLNQGIYFMDIYFNNSISRQKLIKL